MTNSKLFCTILIRNSVSSELWCNKKRLPEQEKVELSKCISFPRPVPHRPCLLNNETSRWRVHQTSLKKSLPSVDSQRSVHSVCLTWTVTAGVECIRKLACTDKVSRILTELKRSGFEVNTLLFTAFRSGVVAQSDNYTWSHVPRIPFYKANFR